MSYVRLKTPEDFFEESFEKTMASVECIRRRRRTILCACIAAVLTAGICYSVCTVRTIEDRREYLAQQEELARLDIFLEIN